MLRNESNDSAIGLRVRDLRRLDFFFTPHQQPSFWVRKVRFQKDLHQFVTWPSSCQTFQLQTQHAVLFILDPIRAIIMANRVIVVVPPGGMDSLLRVLEVHLLEWNGSTPDIATTPTTISLAAVAAAGAGDGKDDAGDSLSVSDSDCSQGQLANVPFELHAYEAILTTATALHAREFDLINAEAQRVLVHFQAKGGSILPFTIQVHLEPS
jgi:hypothetical protein